LGKMLGKVMRKPSGIGSERGKNVLSKDGRWLHGYNFIEICIWYFAFFNI
jgi:hypothetical protein